MACLISSLLTDRRIGSFSPTTNSVFHSPISQRQPPQGHISDWLRGTYSSLIIMGEVFPRIIRSGPPLPVSFTTPPVELTIYWKIQERRQLRRMEQYTRVELVTQPWQGRVLPLN